MGVERMSRFSGEVVVITGGAQGIGLAYAQAFASAGAKVLIADLVDPAPAVAELRSTQAEVEGFQMDITQAAETQACAAYALETFGRLDVLVNNAAFYGGLTLGPFENIDESDWDRSMNVNVKGVWLMSRAVTPTMRMQGSGRIINIASNVVFMGKPNFLHYVTSKGAVWALTNAMSRELAGTGITVNCVAPGYTTTPATRNMGTADEVDVLEQQILEAQSVKRLLTAEDMVGAVLYMASHEASMVTGQTLVIDGGVIVG
jgi:NAD(P)-dependent dehydrogenase (short-subunit alcohol dehydrogenase family)